MDRLLLVEDDGSIVKNLTAFLCSEGFLVKSTAEQQKALAMLEREPFDLVLLDISLKEGNGFSLCTAIKHDYDIPVVFVTASADEYSVVAGLDMGADDYISKPFRPRELASRIRTVLRRSRKGRGTVLEAQGLLVDTAKGTVSKNGRELYLSALEYRLLLTFFNHRGTLLSRTRLLEELWDMAGEFVNDNTLTVYIKRLREKIEDDPQNPQIIRTVRGLGYRID